MSFDALFRKGNLVSVDLNNVEKVPVEERKKAQKHAKEIAERTLSRKNNKLMPLLKPIKFTVGLLLIVLHFVGKNVSKLHARL